MSEPTVDTTLGIPPRGGQAVPIGAHVAGAALVTALVNTIAGYSAPDTLTSVEELQLLLETHDVQASDRLDAGDVDEVRAVRTRLLAVLGTSEEARALAALNALLDGPRYRVGLARREQAGGLQWVAAFPPQVSIAERVQVLGALSLLSVIRTLGVQRFRKCASQTCKGSFVDTSRSGRRKYCRPAVCGNRENVAAYRARQRRPAG